MSRNTEARIEGATMSSVKLSSWFDEQIADPEARRIFEQERLTLAVTSTILETMEHQGVSKADLAKRLDCSRAFVSQVLAGARNMTLHTVADVAWALGCRASLTVFGLDTIGYRPLDLPNAHVRQNPDVVENRDEQAMSTDNLTTGEFAANTHLALAA